MISWLLTCILLLCIIVLPLCWRISASFRFNCKMTAYYLSLFVCGMWCTIVFLFRPRYPDNMCYVWWAVRICTSWLTITWEARDTKLLQVDTPVVLVCNHQSSLDCQGVTYVWPRRCCGMVKRSLFYVPGVGISAWLANAVFVDRFNAANARQSLNDAVADIKRRSLKLWVFPEGTRNHTGNGLLLFKKGAFHIAVQAQVPIIPIVFSDISPFYSSAEKRLELDGYVIAQVLPQISTEGLTSDDVGDLCEKVRTVMLNCYTKISKEAEEKYHNNRLC